MDAILVAGQAQIGDSIQTDVVNGDPVIQNRVTRIARRRPDDLSVGDVVRRALDDDVLGRSLKIHPGFDRFQLVGRSVTQRSRHDHVEDVRLAGVQIPHRHGTVPRPLPDPVLQQILPMKSKKKKKRKAIVIVSQRHLATAGATTSQPDPPPTAAALHPTTGSIQDRVATCP